MSVFSKSDSKACELLLSLVVASNVDSSKSSASKAARVAVAEPMTSVDMYGTTLDLLVLKISVSSNHQHQAHTFQVEHCLAVVLKPLTALVYVCRIGRQRVFQHISLMQSEIINNVQYNTVNLFQSILQYSLCDFWMSACGGNPYCRSRCLCIHSIKIGVSRMCQ